MSIRNPQTYVSSSGLHLSQAESISLTIFDPKATSKSHEGELRIWFTREVVARLPDCTREFDLMSASQVADELDAAWKAKSISESTRDHLLDHCPPDDSLYGLAGGLLVVIPLDLRPVLIADFWRLDLPPLSTKDHKGADLRFPVGVQSRYKRDADAWSTGAGRLSETLDEAFARYNPPF